METNIGALVLAPVAAWRASDPFAPAPPGGFALGALPASPRRSTRGVTMGLSW